MTGSVAFIFAGIITLVMLMNWAEMFSRTKTPTSGEHLGAVYGIRVYNVIQDTEVEYDYISIEEWYKRYGYECSSREYKKRPYPKARFYTGGSMQYDYYEYNAPSCWCKGCEAQDASHTFVKVRTGYHKPITRLVGGFSKVWKTPELTMKRCLRGSIPCRAYGHSSGSCRCGINMYTWRGFLNEVRIQPNSGQVYALTKGTGHVAVHPDGYRSEHAEVIYLYDPFNKLKGETLEGWEDVPVGDNYKTFRTLAKKHSKTKMIKIPDNEG